MKMRLGFESGFLSDTEGDKMNQTSVLQKKKKKKVWKDRCALIRTLGQTKAGQSQDYMVRIYK